METIIIKVPNGTKAKLRQINGNMSSLLREQIERLLGPRNGGSAYEKAADLCGVIKEGPKDASTSKAYLKKHAPKSHH